MAAKKKVAPKKSRAKVGNSKAAAKQRRALFVEYYIANGGNATAAATMAGFSPKTAYSAGGRLLKYVDVSQAIEARRELLRDKVGLTTERVLKELASVVFFDPRKLFAEDGTPKSIADLDDETAAAVAGIEVFEEFEGSGQSRRLAGLTKKYRVTPKNEAIANAMKHLGLFKEDNKQKTDPIRDLMAAIDGNGKLAPQP